MYFPYLRGKQFELIALRELAMSKTLDGNKVIPIVEPVKRGLRSIQTALRALHPVDVKIQLVVNPQVGELVGETAEIFDFIDNQIADGVDNIIPTFLIYSDNDLTLLKEMVAQHGYDTSGYALVHMVPIRHVDELSQYAKDKCLYNTIHINHIFALKRNFSNQAILGDYFRRQRVNADYAKDVDETFSSDYFIFQNEGFVAFSDFQAIGEDWIEGGRLPKAVVIHLTYKDREQDEIRIHHFVSDTNDDTLDIAGKFYQAVTKLVDFADQRALDGSAIRAFRDLHARQVFPGLGVIKKLSIMHHIELIQGLI